MNDGVIYLVYCRSEDQIANICQGTTWFLQYKGLYLRDGASKFESY